MSERQRPNPIEKIGQVNDSLDVVFLLSKFFSGSEIDISAGGRFVMVRSGEDRFEFFTRFNIRTEFGDIKFDKVHESVLGNKKYFEDNPPFNPVSPHKFALKTIRTASEYEAELGKRTKDLKITGPFESLKPEDAEKFKGFISKSGTEPFKL